MLQDVAPESKPCPPHLCGTQPCSDTRQPLTQPPSCVLKLPRSFRETCFKRPLKLPSSSPGASAPPPRLPAPVKFVSTPPPEERRCPFKVNWIRDLTCAANSPVVPDRRAVVGPVDAVAGVKALLLAAVTVGYVALGVGGVGGHAVTLEPLAQAGCQQGEGQWRIEQGRVGGRSSQKRSSKSYV